MPVNMYLAQNKQKTIQKHSKIEVVLHFHQCLSLPQQQPAVIATVIFNRHSRQQSFISLLLIAREDVDFFTRC